MIRVDIWTGTVSGATVVDVNPHDFTENVLCSFAAADTPLWRTMAEGVAVALGGMVPLYAKLARLLLAIQNCERDGNTEWLARHTASLHDTVDAYMPRGSGFDSGTNVDVEASTKGRIVLHTSFHHMDEHGGYDGWSDYTVTVKPSLAFGFDVKVTGGRGREDRDYVVETFAEALQEVVPAYD